MAVKSHIIIRKRAMVVLLAAGFVLVLLSGRLGYLQLYKSHWLSENAVDQRIRNIPVEARRGVIYDRNGKELAVSHSIASVYAIPAEIKDVQTTAANLAAILDLDAEKLAKKLKQRQAFTWVARKIAEDQAVQIQRLDIKGIGITEEGERYYPQEKLAAHVLGFTGLDSQGLDGVELIFDSYLKGVAGSINVEYDGGGREIPQAEHRYIAPREGNYLYLTIDLVIQKIVERELEKAMRETGAKGATVIVMDPNTGEILALANRPTYDPNTFGEYAPKSWRNIALSNVYEPGSTFKILTAAAALDSKTVSEKDYFFDPGGIEVQGRTIHCWKNGGHGNQSFQAVVENSCNPGFVAIGLKLGTDKFYEYLDSFGLGKATGLDLPGEAKGLLIKKAKVQPINIATMAMGQSIAVTPMQLISAISASVNGGTYFKPQIVREIKSSSGSVVEEFAPKMVNQVIDSDVSERLRVILESVVANGTGKNAYVQGMRIGGKTGTAQKVGAGGYLPDQYVASFVGFAPADKPQLVILVVVDEPEGMYYGGQVAAPIFKDIIEDVGKYFIKK